MNQIFLPKAGELLDNAFAKARKQSVSGKMNKQKMRKLRAIKKIETVGKTIEERLEKTVKDFPSVEKMNPFAKEMLEATIDVNKTKKALAQFSAVQRIIKKIRIPLSRKIWATDPKQERMIAGIEKEFIGRLASVLKGMDKSIENYNDAARRMNELPNIESDIPTIVLSGFPNVGKTTILARLTGSRAAIASYPFTTKKLQLGYFEARYLKIQVIDTPGLLDRSLGDRNSIEKKAIAALKHLAKIIVFVLDPTLSSGYSLQEQLNLLEEIKKQFNCYIMIALNKTDLARKEEIETARQSLPNEEIFLEGENVKSTLKEKIGEKLRATK